MRNESPFGAARLCSLHVFGFGSDIVRGRLWSLPDRVSNAVVDVAAGRGVPEGEPVDEEMIELCLHHGLISILAEESGAPVAVALRGKRVALQELMRVHLSRILERFEEAGIRVAVVKGPRMADTFYEVPRLRPFSDIDLLVEPASLDRALSTLASDEAVPGIPEKGPKADKRDVPFRDPSGVGFTVDLHWDLFAYSQLRGDAEGATASGWESATHLPDSALGPHWAMPTDIELSFLATHAILDHRFRLILFRDFLEIANGEVPWDDVITTAGRFGLRSTSYISLMMAAGALGADIPEAVLASLRPSSASVRYLEYGLPRTDFVRFDGYQTHPVNFASVLLNDSLWGRLALAARAPFAFRGWSERNAEERHSKETELVSRPDDERDE